ncbi:MAG: response regulator [Candidatus Wallbacteria bacterium]|nr:response regulator [Candidatus Wallbacteria bacterium]
MIDQTDKTLGNPVVKGENLTVEQLTQERNLSNQYLEMARVMFVAIHRSGKVTMVNNRTCEILGLPKDQIIGKDWFEHFLPPDHRDIVKGVFDQLVNGQIAPVEHFENKVLLPDGTERLISWHNTLLKDGTGHITGTLSAGEDITEKRAAEESRQKYEAQMYHTQKLESIGLLAGGIAHDFNNLLMVIMGSADLAMMQASPDCGAMEHLENICRASKRAAELCSQLLAYAGKGMYQISGISLNFLVKEMAGMLSLSIGKTIDVRFDLFPELPLVQGDAAQFQQLVMNLITNASEAISDCSGQIRITTGVTDCERNFLRSTILGQSLQAGEYVFLEVYDNGCGMTGEIRDKIFDPFFTTKAAGRGLGMAAVIGIVRSHGGTLTVESAPERGTSIRLYFRAETGSDRMPDNPQFPEEPLKLSGTVLLVDDEEDVRTTGEMMLNCLGLQVITAGNGREALELFRKMQGRISLVILDLTMPKMGGIETFNHLRRMDRKMAVLVSSGYSEQDVIQRFADADVAGFIQKPYRLEALRTAISRVLTQ